MPHLCSRLPEPDLQGPWRETVGYPYASSLRGDLTEFTPAPLGPQGKGGTSWVVWTSWRQSCLVGLVQPKGSSVSDRALASCGKHCVRGALGPWTGTVQPRNDVYFLELTRVQPQGGVPHQRSCLTSCWLRGLPRQSHSHWFSLQD